MEFLFKLDYPSKSASFCDLVMQIYYATYCIYFIDIPLLGFIFIFGYIPWLREIKFILLLLKQ